MKQYIDKSALVAEIERIENELNSEIFTDEFLGKRWFCKHIKPFLDTLEVKEVDFERELSKYVSQGIHRFFPNEGNDYYNIDSVEWQDYVIDTAKHFFDLGLKAQKGD